MAKRKGINNDVQNTKQKTKDWIPLITGGKLLCSGRVSISYRTSQGYEGVDLRRWIILYDVNSLIRKHIGNIFVLKSVDYSPESKLHMSKHIFAYVYYGQWCHWIWMWKIIYSVFVKHVIFDNEAFSLFS